ncbi:ribonucleoside-triphosphate reductase [Volucribacter amazonae]|uniref:Ribonucleoside-triphosphate reductase n=1 Tax=Volucribacter amazonae TaxID=256731 RepID=A0A9X4PIZ4_9PAST|nr:ribonucleoside-triphosphate reductase [Volucribacter amazonae]MDG6896230.1 ribonucleoside-triphosphate reductase [Volucribacter amazonae]
MLKNPFKNDDNLEKEQSDFVDAFESKDHAEQESDPFITEEEEIGQQDKFDSTLKAIEPVIEDNKPLVSSSEPVNSYTFNKFNGNEYKYQSQIKTDKLQKRDIEQDLNDEEYHQRLVELNTDAENKHYILFFGQPASGKTWIIGSILHYMKNYLGGTVYLDTQKTTESEEELFYQLQDRFNGVIHAEKITSTDTKQYFEFHICFTPKDSSKPPINMVFIDASGEHSEQGFRTKHNNNSGQLPNYLTAILESNVKTKLVFVYDQSLQDERGSIPQVNVLDAVFIHIQHIQKRHNKFFPKALLMSKSDRIYASDYSTVERCGGDAMTYAVYKIPAFANSFFNESPENKTIFYQMGKFSTNSDLLLEFDKECPERLFRWLYMTGTGGISPIKEQSCWDKFMAWLKGK